jgi:dTDP-4-amino-4,6-dideoxygalactose transaminase
MDAVLTAMVEDKIGPGEQTRLLVQVAKEHIGFDFCLALRSPAIALGFALKALNLEDGQGVLISALSPQYYIRVIEDLRLKPVFCDVLPSQAVIGRETIEAVLHGGDQKAVPRCIVLRHTLGFSPDTAGIAALGLPVIEDCSQSYGTPLSEEKAEASAVFAILGLEERDMLTAGGGALLYAANRRNASALRNLGEIPPEYCLADMNAAMAVIQFKEASRNLEKRKEIAQVYTQSSLRTRHKRFITQGEYNNYAFPLILETGLKDVKAYAKRKEIVVESAFENSIADIGEALPAFYPESYSLSLRTVLFPIYPRLGTAEIERVSKLIMTLP